MVPNLPGYIPNSAWDLYFLAGQASYAGKGNWNFVRAVRGGF
jgi:hypothetical protein